MHVGCILTLTLYTTCAYVADFIASDHNSPHILLIQIIPKYCLKLNNY